MPPPTNIIFNGTFDLQGSGWSGVDIEAQNREGQYFGNGSTNRVVELDGGAIQTTVMQQTIAIAAPLTTELTFQAALRTIGTPGVDGFRVDILNSLGVVIATVTIIPPVGPPFVNYSVPVTFPAAGNYTVRFTEVGNNDSLGVVLDNVAMLVCFAGPTLTKPPKARLPPSTSASATW